MKSFMKEIPQELQQKPVRSSSIEKSYLRFQNERKAILKFSVFIYCAYVVYRRCSQSDL